MRIIDGIIFVASGSNFAERSGINKFTPPERGFKDLTVSGASVDTTGAQSAHRRNATGTVGGTGSFIGIGLLKIHFE
jgi:hypothetical protein